MAGAGDEMMLKVVGITVGLSAWIQPVDATDWLNRSAGVS